MSDPTPIPPPAIPTLPTSGESLYNAIMQDINPELMFPAITGLKEQYQNEPADLSAERARRYRADFEEYVKRYAAVRSAMITGVRSYTLGMLKYIEHLWQGKEQVDLEAITSHIDQAVL